MPENFFGGVIYIISTYWPMFLQGVLNTLYLSLTATVIGCVIGLIVAVIRLLPVDNPKTLKSKMLKGLKAFLGCYVEFIRGTPMIVQAIFIFYGGRQIGLDWNVMQASLFIVTLNTGAYGAEIMRGGISSVDSGQLEGARAIGMNYVQAMYHVVIPQAIRNSLPAIGNEFVTNIKDTAVLNVIALNDLFLQAKTISGIYFRPTETFLVTALIYFVLTYSVTRVINYIERRYDCDGGVNHA